jgi:hypothetical protein
VVEDAAIPSAICWTFDAAIGALAIELDPRNAVLLSDVIAG